MSTGARAVPSCEAIQAAEAATIPLPALGRKIFVGAYLVLNIKINEQNKVGLPPSVILTACLCSRTSRNVELFLTPGKIKKNNLCLSRLTGQIMPMGCLACGMLSLFVTPADFSPISMFYGLLNVFSLQKSVHLATLALTSLFTHWAAFLSACTPCHRSTLRNCFQKLIWYCKESHVSASQIYLRNIALDLVLYFTPTLEQLNCLSFVLNKIFKILFWFEKQVSFLT